MILYLETSRLIKLYIGEADSDAVRESLSSADAVACSIVGYAEARAAFARKRREKEISARSYETVKTDFDRDWERIVALAATEDIVRKAGALAELHALRGFDALHLASACALREATSESIVFSTADDRLRQAAKREDFL